jgi:hypothetical protein
VLLPAPTAMLKGPQLKAKPGSTLRAGSAANQDDLEDSCSQLGSTSVDQRRTVYDFARRRAKIQRDYEMEMAKIDEEANGDRVV